MIDKHFGVIVLLRSSYGFLKTEQDKVKLYFSRSDLPKDGELKVGNRVCYIPSTSPKGPCAKNIELLNDGGVSSAVAQEQVLGQQSYMAQAVIARDNRQFELAERLYSKALDTDPTLQTVLSFAAMEKNRGRKKEAMQIYLDGLRKVPARKIYEDAAALATSLKRFGEARELLTKALENSKPGTQNGLYLSLARNAFKENSASTLKEAIKYYERALQTASPATLPKGDMLSLNIARLRVQHHRGNLAFNFFNKESFKILNVEFLEVLTHGADLTVSIMDKELTESFGIESKILVRVFFKGTVLLDDIDALATRIQELSSEQGTDDQFCLMVTSSVPDELKKVLFARIENKNKLYPAIIPLSQELIETESSQSGLNEVLGQWLYRRDLFNVNFPVVGRRFFGRNRDLDELRDAISDSIPVGLFGLRKVGKTSLLKELARRAGDSGDVYIYLDLLRVPSDVLDFKWIYWRLSSELHKVVSQISKIAKFKWRLGGQYESFLDLPDGFPVATAFDADLTSLLENIQNITLAPKPKVVFLLDEIERVLPNSQGKEGLSGYFDFFSYLRGVSQEAGHFSLVVTGANAAISEVAQFDGRDNPAFNFLKPIYLKLLPPQDCNAMLTALARGMGIKFSKGAIPSIVALTGGHPFFSRQFCSFIAERYRERPLEITEDMIDATTDPYIPFCDKDMQEIFDRLARDYPDELDFCVRLANNGDAPKISIDQGGFTAASLRHLVGYQLIDHSGEKLQFTMTLLKMWLNKRMGGDYDL